MQDQWEPTEYLCIMSKEEYSARWRSGGGDDDERSDGDSSTYFQNEL